MKKFLLWYDRSAAPVRWSILVALALVVYGAGYLAAVRPLGQRADRLEAEAAEALRRVESQERLVARAETPSEALTGRLEALRDSLRRGAAEFPEGLESGLLTAFSRSAEAAGASSPIFNLRRDTAAPPPLEGFRVLTVEGDLMAGTRAVADFLRRLEELPLPVVLDSMALVRQVPRNGLRMRLHVLAPAEADAD